jgi:hypothetical protein
MKSGIINANEKESLAIAEIADDFPAVALFFRNKKDGGVLLATKAQSNITKFFPIPVSVNNDLISDEEEPQSEERGVIVGGVGNYAEFRRLLKELNKIIRDEINNYGLHTNLTEIILERFAGFMNDEYRSADSISPYRAELLIISFLEDQIKMFRVKSDGDYHPAMPYCIIGGYKKTHGETIRRKALRILRKAYAKKIFPSLAECQKITEKILDMDKKHGGYQEIIPFQSPLCAPHNNNNTPN